MRLKGVTAAVLFAVSLISQSALAQQEKWDIDPAHSSITFDIRHTFAVVRGVFLDFSGTVVFDPDAKMLHKCDFEVQVDSVNTHITQRDDHLRTPDFFDAARYPTMRFDTTEIKKRADNQYAVTGTLTIKDVSQTITVPVTFLGVRDNPLNPKQQVAGFETEFSIDRLAYHVGSGKFYDMGVVGKDVSVMVSLEVTRDK